jgi:hypothetical protein
VLGKWTNPSRIPPPMSLRHPRAVAGRIGAGPEGIGRSWWWPAALQTFRSLTPGVDLADVRAAGKCSEFADKFLHPGASMG